MENDYQMVSVRLNQRPQKNKTKSLRQESSKDLYLHLVLCGGAFSLFIFPLLFSRNSKASFYTYTLLMPAFDSDSFVQEVRGKAADGRVKVAVDWCFRSDEATVKKCSYFSSFSKWNKNASLRKILECISPFEGMTIWKWMRLWFGPLLSSPPLSSAWTIVGWRG